MMSSFLFCLFFILFLFIFHFHLLFFFFFLSKPTHPPTTPHHATPHTRQTSKSDSSDVKQACCSGISHLGVHCHDGLLNNQQLLLSLVSCLLLMSKERLQVVRLAAEHTLISLFCLRNDESIFQVVFLSRVFCGFLWDFFSLNLQIMTYVIIITHSYILL